MPRQGDWYPDVDMVQGFTARISVFESLAAFYPGNQVLLGEINPSIRSENSFTTVREFLGFLPERFDYSNWKTMNGHASHPLRPEIHESNYFLHMATKDIAVNNIVTQGFNSTSGWLWSADFAIDELEKRTKTACGYGVVTSVDTGTTLASLGVKTRSNIFLKDEMPSFFLSETLKYFYLAFDANNPLNNDKERDWVFTTEAHPIHNVPRLKAKQSGSYAHDTVKERVIKKLKSRISESASANKNQSFTNYIELEENCAHLGDEKWSKSTTSQLFINNLKQTLDTSDSTSNGHAGQQFSEVFGRIVKRSGAELNFATIEHNKCGRGAQLSRSCPNYHHPNSLWIHAINGDQIAYTDLFVTSFYDEATTIEKVLPALTSSALFGVSYMSDDDSVCSFTERERHEEKDKYSHSTNVTPQGTQRIDMGKELGTFDINVYNGEGFYIKHVESGESVEATIIDKRPQQAEPFIAIESYIPVKVKKRKTNGLLLKLGSSFSMLKSVFTRKNNIIVPLSRDTRHYDRSVMMSDLKGNTYSCRVEIIHATGKDESGIFKKKNIVGEFPCLPGE